MVGLFVIRNYMNDSLRTDVFLRYSAETVACACIYLSARALQVSYKYFTCCYNISYKDKDSPHYTDEFLND